MKFYSQFKQDEFLYNILFKDFKTGFFIDIGAYDGIIDSNTLFFEELGWDGICIEPNPSKFEKLTNSRKCKCIKCAISDKEGQFEFFQIKEGGPDTLSGLSEEFTENAIKRINCYNFEESQLFDYITVECKTFESILSNNFNIDYLSLDTEGNELKILKTIDFNKYNIKSITVENNEYNTVIYDFLIQKDYTLIQRLGCDEVYIKNEYLKLIKI